MNKMYRVCLLALAVIAFTGQAFADVKITELPSASSMAGTDIFPIVADPGGTPTTKKITKTALNFAELGVTLVTVAEPITVGYMEDGGTAPDAASVVTSTRKVRVREFSGTADQSLEFVWPVPANYDSGVKFRWVGYVTASTAPADTEHVAFSLAGCSNADSDALGCTVGTAQTSDYTVSGSGFAQYDRLAGPWSAAIAVTGIAAGETAHFNLIRLATSTDTYGQKIGLAYIEIQYQSKLANNY